MTAANSLVSHKVLLVDDDDAVRDMMTMTLRGKGLEVVAASNVAQALKLITSESFDVLVTDLHMPNPGDGLTVVTAMRHAQPHALTLLVSGYPDVDSALAAILLEADEIIVKPFQAGELADHLRAKMLNRKPVARVEKQAVGEVLHRCLTAIVKDWLARVKESPELNHLSLSDQDRTGHLPKLIEDLVVRLRKPRANVKDGDATHSSSAVAHGTLRYGQGYTPAMLVHESRILQVTLFATLQKNLSLLDFSLLLPDVMTIADEVDAQLTQTMESFMNSMRRSAVA
jgi:DNA-binding response OmpR family regulator